MVHITNTSKNYKGREKMSSNSIQNATSSSQKEYASKVICVDCNGSGEGITEKHYCTKCGGTGELDDYEEDEDDFGDDYDEEDDEDSGS